MFNSENHRVGIIGGSFDPIHLGHLVIAQDALERLELDEIVFIPAAIPPHKLHLERVGAEHRLRMVELAIEGDHRFSVSDIELIRGGISYTIDTVQALQASRPDVDWMLIVGSDTLVDLHHWHRIEDLLDLCNIASFLRPGESSLDRIAEKIELPEHRKAQLLNHVIEAHLIEISSTEIRMRVAEGLGIRYLVPPEVEMYICEHGLYRG
ncbi:MAG: nicotinate-nucleotide adenylyltransferase [Pontiellaceae bacterium]|nr:nicotinate-nucleotide adenylyltransferase [Pontiellaceae bacterium]